MAPRKRVPIRVCARIGGAAAHNGHAPSETGRARPRRLRRRATGPEAPHTPENELTAAVFHALMFALNADAERNACAPKPHAVHADGKGSHGSAQMRARPIPYAHARA
jgi:hypothetical protein